MLELEDAELELAENTIRLSLHASHLAPRSDERRGAREDRTDARCHPERRERSVRQLLRDVPLQLEQRELPAPRPNHIEDVVDLELVDGPRAGFTSGQFHAIFARPNW